MAEPIRYGVVGTGMMGIEHIRNIAWLDGAVLTAIADPHGPSRDAGLEQARRAAARVHFTGTGAGGADATDATPARGRAGAGAADTTAPDPQVFEHGEELLASGLCDAVVVASPNMTHAEVLQPAWGRPVHLLVEKPMCTTVEDCREVVRRAREHPAQVAIGLEYRFMPSTRRFVSDVHAGAVGRLRMLSIREHRFPFLVKVGNWNRFNRNSGGTLVEKCCHFFDLMRLVARADPVRVVASGGQDVNHLDEVYDGEASDILDNAFVTIEFQGGVRAMLDLCMFAEATHSSEELSAVGDKGKLEALLPQNEVRTGRRGEHWIGGVDIASVEDDRVRYQGHHHGASYLEHLDFIDAIRQGRPPEVGPVDGLWSVAMGVAAQLSIEEGRWVDLAEVMRE